MIQGTEVEVQVGSARLAGDLVVPETAIGLVIFAHGSGSSRHSPRNRFVAEVLNRSGMGTLLFDLLTVEEEQDRRNVFDVTNLGSRLVEVTLWLDTRPEVSTLSVGYFGASTGAGAALVGAADERTDVAAVVSRGGRPDLAGEFLGRVRSPTLLVVGGRDAVVESLNRQARAELECENRLVIVPGATHLFEEPGTLERVAELASDWFVTHFRGED